LKRRVFWRCIREAYGVVEGWAVGSGILLERGRGKQAMNGFYKGKYCRCGIGDLGRFRREMVLELHFCPLNKKEGLG